MNRLQWWGLKHIDQINSVWGWLIVVVCYGLFFGGVMIVLTWLVYLLAPLGI